jgi:hypothetical protein
MYWTNSEISTLETCVALNIPYSQAAHRCGKSLGAFCAKVKRLGIGKGPKGQKFAYRKTRRQQERALMDNSQDEAFLAIMADQALEAEHRQGHTIALDRADQHHCTFVIGEPSARQCCGVRRLPGQAYCQEHHKRCFTQPDGRSERYLIPRSPQRTRRFGTRFGHPPLTYVDSRTLEAHERDPGTAAIST